MDDILVIHEVDAENGCSTTKYWLTQSAKEGSIKHIVSQMLKDYSVLSSNIQILMTEYDINVNSYNRLFENYMKSKRSRDYKNYKYYKLICVERAIYLKKLKRTIKIMQRSQCHIQESIMRIVNTNLHNGSIDVIRVVSTIRDLHNGPMMNGLTNYDWRKGKM